jgi:hypothetical protein
LHPILSPLCSPVYEENKKETESGVSKDTHRQENKEETQSVATKNKMDAHRQEDKEKTVSDSSDKAQTVKIEIPKSIEVCLMEEVVENDQLIKI